MFPELLHMHQSGVPYRKGSQIVGHDSRQGSHVSKIKINYAAQNSVIKKLARTINTSFSLMLRYNRMSSGRAILLKHDQTALLFVFLRPSINGYYGAKCIPLTRRVAFFAICFTGGV
jgi:hypothetical protein